MSGSKLKNLLSLFRLFKLPRLLKLLGNIIFIFLFLKGEIFAADLEKEEKYFAVISNELKSHHIAQPLLFIDLDRLDHNIDVLLSHLRSPVRFRVVEKSLPSIEL